MLMENAGLPAQSSTYIHEAHHVPGETYTTYPHYGHSFTDYRDWRHNPALRFVKDHPLLCVAAVAAVVAIGPKRVARGAAKVASSGGALTALTLRNRANVEMLGNLITTVIDAVQRNRMRPRP
jgi:hypothetical protein